MLSYKTRKRLSILALVVGLPLYIIVAVNIVALFDRPPLLVELLIYVVLGFLWIVPLKKVFLGVGKAEPGSEDDTGRPD